MEVDPLLNAYPGAGQTRPGPWVRWRRFARRHKLNSGLVFILPALGAYLLYIAWPIISIIQLSFYDWDGISAGSKLYVGLENYRELVTQDRPFHLSIRNNLLWALLTISVLLVLGFALAYLLNQKLRLRNFYRSAIFLPVATSSIVVGFTWHLIYDPRLGILNDVLHALGLDGLTRTWLGDPKLAIYSVIVVAIWHNLGVWVVVFLAALQTIPQDLFDCAAIDGATGFRKMIHVAVPLTMSTARALIILGLIGAVNQFSLVYVLTKGGPYHASEVMAYQIYRLAFTTHRTGYAAALSALLLLIAAIITVAQLVMSRNKVELLS